MFYKTALPTAVAAALSILSGTAVAQENSGAFFDDTKVTGGFYVFSRKRDRYNLETREYEDNLDHTSIMTNIDISTGYANEMIGFDFGIFAAADIKQNSGVGHEFNFVPWDTPYEATWTGKEENGASIYKAAIKFKTGNYWAKAGYIQPSGPGGLGTNWNFMPGTYQGTQIGANFNKLQIAYTWANEYKAPWFNSTYEFKNNNGKKIDYIHSLGAIYTFNNGFSIDGAFSQSKDFLDTYHIKLKNNLDVAGGNLYLSYQFYGADDTRNVSDADKVYDGRAWMQALMASYSLGSYTFRAEAMATKAEGNQGYFIYRTTTNSGSSQGRNEIWWDSRSDWSHDDEKAVFFGVWRDFADLGKPGWSAGISYAYGWDGKPHTGYKDQTVEFKEEAFNLDIDYTFQDGDLKGASVSVHMTKYNNQSGVPNWEGFKGSFQDEHDIKVSMVFPFSF